VTWTMLSKDRCILHVDNPDWGASHGLVRDFRLCTRTVSVGPSLYAMRGPAALQSMVELRVQVLANMNLHGIAESLTRTVQVLITEHHLRGVTVAGCLAQDVMQSVADVVKSEQLFPAYSQPPRILGAMNPTSKSRNREVRAVVSKARDAGLHGLLLDFCDLALVRRVWPAALLVVPARRPPMDTRKRMNRRLRALPGITEVLTAGADHVLLPDKLLDSYQADWQAEMAKKEVEQIYPPEPEQGVKPWE